MSLRAFKWPHPFPQRTFVTFGFKCPFLTRYASTTEGNCVLQATLPSCPYTARNKLKVHVAVLFSFRRIFVFTSCSNCFINHGRGNYKKIKVLKKNCYSRLQINEALLASFQGKVERYTLNTRVVKLQAALSAGNRTQIPQSCSPCVD